MRLNRAFRCCAFVALLACAGIRAAPLSVVHKLWADVALKAAERTLEAIQQQNSLELSLRDVPLETLALYVGREHQLAVEVGGKEYQLTLATTPDAAAQQQQQRGGQPQQGALPGREQQLLRQLPSSALVQFEPQQWQQQHIELPEITLAGPVELVLSHATSINMWLPHMADADRVQRVLVAPGATLTLSRLRSIGLRRPVQLPRLPVSYLAEVYASARLGQDEPGVENAPGMYYLASELFKAATNASLAAPAEGGATQWLLSFDVDPEGPLMSLVSAPPHPTLPAPRLKAKRTRDGTLEVSLRAGAGSGDASAPAPAATHAAQPPQARREECDDLDRPQACSVVAAPPAPLAPHRLWAWPLPLVDMADWIPYETLLRSTLTSQPLEAAAAAGPGGLGLRLTRSSMRGVRMMHFEMHVRGADVAMRRPDARSLDPNLAVLDDADGAGSLQVWEVLVQLQAGPSGGIECVPVSAKRKHAYHSTLTLSKAAVATLLGANNASAPLPRGFESMDEGLARYADAP